MNINDNFYNAKLTLDEARDKFDRQDYEGALVSMCYVMSHSRALIEQIYKLKALKAECESTKGD